MNDVEQQSLSIEEKKEKIRQRYKGVDENLLSVIPANPKLDIFDHNQKLRVAVYARVSTDDPNQTSSYELQKNHYTDLVKHNPNWDLVDIYADEGISGTSLQHRDNFIRMINDCKSGIIDLIVTKSVSRFARNIIDGVGYVRMLGMLNPPVGVFFETENINTLNKDSEMTLTIMSAMAQEESHTKSEIMNASIEMRFKRGIFLTPPLLGYDQDEEGNLVINEEEAKTVRLIFLLFIFGYSTSQIAETLEKLHRKTKLGKTKWTSSSVMAQLKNERHCGSVLARKTFTPNYLDHKAKKNNKDRNQYLQENHHEAIISNRDFIYVQRIIANTKNGNNNILPQLRAISNGLLAGYVFINPRWFGFKPIDYIHASKTASQDFTENKDDLIVKVETGDFDLRGYEIARSQFFNVNNRLALSISANKICFTVNCIQKLQCENIEILIHPTKKYFVVRAAEVDSRLNFKWSKKVGERFSPKDISITSIAPCLFELIGWNLKNRYRLFGNFHQESNSTLLIFNLSDSEIYIPNESEKNIDGYSSPDNFNAFGTTKSTLAFPSSWADDFGYDYYTHINLYESSIQSLKDPIVISSNTLDYNPSPEIEIPDFKEIEESIKNIYNDMSSEESKNVQSKFN